MNHVIIFRACCVLINHSGIYLPRTVHFGSNDASFNNGNGFNDAIIAVRHMANGAITPPALDLSTIGIISSTTTTPTYASTTGQDIDTLSYVIPAGCTKVYIFGSMRLQAQNSTTQDMSWWVDYNAGASVTKSSFFTSTSVYNGGNVSLFDTLAVAGGTTRTFKTRAMTTSGGSFNAGNRTVFIIPAFN